jgi:hypothetical protein
VASSVPGMIQLIDVVMYYPQIPMNNTTQQVMVNSNTFTASSSTGLLLTHTNDFGSTVSTITSVKFTTTGTLPVGLNTTDTFYITRFSSTTSKVSTSMANALATPPVYIAYDITGMSGTHTMTVTPNRYADGAGLRCMLVSTANVTTSVAAAIQDNTASSGTEYINQAGNTKQFGAAVTHAAVGANIPLISRISHSAVAANGYGPALPLASGDTGIRQLRAHKLSTAYTGASIVCAVIYKPLATIPIVTTGVAGERNLLMQLPSLPRIYDGACLSLQYFNGTGLATDELSEQLAELSFDHLPSPSGGMMG